VLLPTDPKSRPVFLTQSWVDLGFVPIRLVLRKELKPTPRMLRALRRALADRNE